MVQRQFLLWEVSTKARSYYGNASTFRQRERVRRVDTLSDIYLVGTISVELGQMTKVEELFLRGNALTGELPTALGDLLEVKNCLMSAATNCHGFYQLSWAY